MNDERLGARLDGHDWGSMPETVHGHLRASLSTPEPKRRSLVPLMAAVLLMGVGIGWAGSVLTGAPDTVVVPHEAPRDTATPTSNGIDPDRGTILPGPFAPGHRSLTLADPKRVVVNTKVFSVPRRPALAHEPSDWTVLSRTH